MAGARRAAAVRGIGLDLLPPLPLAPVEEDTDLLVCRKIASQIAANIRPLSRHDDHELNWAAGCLACQRPAFICHTNHRAGEGYVENAIPENITASPYPQALPPTIMGDVMGGCVRRAKSALPSG